MDGRHRRPDDGGESLVEILIALVILGLAVAALTAGLAASSRTTAQHRYHVDGAAHLVKAAEALKSRAYDTTCAPETTYRNTVTQPVTGASPRPAPVPTTWTTAVAVRYWDADEKAFFLDDATRPDACLDSQSSVPAYLKMQRVTVAVTSPDGAVTEEISIVKRRL